MKKIILKESNMKHILEETIIEEKETIININNYDKKVELYTSDKKVFKKLYKKLGNPQKVFPPAKPKNKGSDIYISGACWEYDYFKDRDKLKHIFSMTNLLPRKKDEEEIKEG